MMAPESERAKCTCECHKKFMSCSICCPNFGNKLVDACAKCGNTANPTDHVCQPTLTCSEVVERLAKCVRTSYFGEEMTHFLDRKQAEAILHSWREHRVQELEEALREIIAESDQSNGGKGAKLPIVLYMKELAEKALKGGGSHGE